MLEKREYALDDSGIAYAYIMIMALLILGSLLWMVMVFGFNQFMDPINDQITAGTMSTQTAGPIIFGLQILQAVPVFLIFGALIWGVLAAVNRRNLGG